MTRIKAVFVPIFLSSFLLLTACSAPELIPEKFDATILKREQEKQSLSAHQYQLSQKARLLEAARPLLTSNTADCPQAQKYSLGVLLHRIDDYPIKQRQAITSLYSLDKRLQVLHILKNSPAMGHISPGDILLSINDEPILPEKGLSQLQAALKNGSAINLGVLRQGNALTINILPELICSYPVILSSSDTINGYADGTNIIITAGLLRFATQDNELALIIAHEMAHNTLNHVGQRFQNSAAGALLDLVLISNGIPSPLIATGIGAHLHSKGYEMEADLAGLRLLQNAGYDISGLDDFWRRMASLYPHSITHGKQNSHPTTVKRALQLEKAIEKLKIPETLSTK